MEWISIVLALLLPAASHPTKSHRDDAGARDAFSAAYTVLMHPRCMNCHPATDRPLQGNDQHPHQPAAWRGQDGLGVAGNHCAACHTDRGDATAAYVRMCMRLGMEAEGQRIDADADTDTTMTSTREAAPPAAATVTTTRVPEPEPRKAGRVSP